MLGENSADDSAMQKIIQKCTHCGDDTNKGNKFCKNCTRAEERRDMCRENKEINSEWKCKTCKV